MLASLTLALSKWNLFYDITLFKYLLKVKMTSLKVSLLLFYPIFDNIANNICTKKSAQGSNGNAK